MWEPDWLWRAGRPAWSSPHGRRLPPVPDSTDCPSGIKTLTNPGRAHSDRPWGGCRDRAGSVRDGGVRNAGPEEQLPKLQERGRADCSVSVRGRRKLPTVRHSLSGHGSAFPRTKVLGGGCTGRMHRPTTSLASRAPPPPPPPPPQAARRRLCHGARRPGRAVLLLLKLRPSFGCGLGSPKSSKPHFLPKDA